MFIEVANFASYDVVRIDDDISVAVWTALLVEETNGVTNLVCHYAKLRGRNRMRVTKDGGKRQREW